MLTLFKDGLCYLNMKFEPADILVAGKTILQIGKPGFLNNKLNAFELTEIDCKNCFISPGFIDSQLMLAGGSGESGFLSQSPRIYVEECVRGGITTVVGTIGVDTITKNMPQLFACVRAFREAGMGAYAYSGGYEIPPRTLTRTLREDILFVDEIIGAGEVAIADHRAPEPSVNELARVFVDSHVAGFLSGKSGVTRIHVGEGKRRLQTIREILEQHEVSPSSLYFTHLERSHELVEEGILIARRGSFVDFDIHENDLDYWYKYYLDRGGPAEKLSFSSDAGISSPSEVWQEIRKCTMQHNCSLDLLLAHTTAVPAAALKLNLKGHLAVGKDADVIVITKDDLEIRDVMANGKLFLKNGGFIREEASFLSRRGLDSYGLKT